MRALAEKTTITDTINKDLTLEVTDQVLKGTRYMASCKTLHTKYIFYNRIKTKNLYSNGMTSYDIWSRLVPIPQEQNR